MGGVTIRDPVTGHVLGSRPQTLQERFPTGRKICAGPCGRWRHLVDFSPKGRWIQSWCRTCQRSHARKSSRPRQPLSRIERNRRKRLSYAKKMRHIKRYPRLHQEYLEEQRLRQWDRRRKAGIPERHYRAREDRTAPRVDPQLFLEWLLWVRPTLTDWEREAIRRVRDGRQKLLSLKLIDGIMTRYGAADQFRVFYPPRGLTRARKKAKTRDP